MQAYHQMYNFAKTLKNKTKGKVQRPKAITPEVINLYGVYQQVKIVK